MILGKLEHINAKIVDSTTKPSIHIFDSGDRKLYLPAKVETTGHAHTVVSAAKTIVKLGKGGTS